MHKVAASYLRAAAVQNPCSSERMGFLKRKSNGGGATCGVVDH